MSETEIIETPTRWIALELLVMNPNNVNEMTEGEFNALCEGVRQSKHIPTITVAPLPDGRFFIVDGNHRYKAARLLGLKTMKCEVLEDLTDEGLQEILSARMVVVRGTVNKRKFTATWLKLREHLPPNKAMEVLGITSERRLNQLVYSSKRTAAAGTMAQDEVRLMLNKARIVDDLADVIRAAIGDGGVQEFEYLVFQVRRAQLVLVRCDVEQMDVLRTFVEKAKERGVNPAAAMVQRLGSHG